MTKVGEYSIMAGIIAIVAGVTTAVVLLPTQPAKSHRVKDQARVHYQLGFDPNGTGLNGLGTDGRFIPPQPWKVDPTTGEISPQ